MEENYQYKSFDFTKESRPDKIRGEYFNPYGYNIYSSVKEKKSSTYDLTHKS